MNIIGKKGKLIIISGPSGVGKKTVWTNVVNQKKYNTIFSVSMTTRPKRINEVDKVDYFFVTKQEFEQAIKEKKLLEWAIFAGNYYGTPKDFVISKLNEGYNVFLEIETQGVLQILKNFGNNKNDILTIFISPPSIQILKKRLLERKTEVEDAIEKRIKQAEWELNMTHNFHHIIVNGDINQAKKELSDILEMNLRNE